MAHLLPPLTKLPRPARYIAVCLLAALAGIYLINMRYERLEIEGHHFYDNATQKIWAHRGYAKIHAENSIPAFQQALDRGAAGIELDIFFDPATNHFWVAHDMPAPEDKTLRLETVFKEFAEKTHYWLDFKNLADLEYSDAAKAAHTIAAMATRYAARPLIMVESNSASHLSVFKSLGVHTALWVSLDPRNSWLMRQYHTLRIKYLLGTNGINAASFYIKQFDPRAADLLPNTDIYLFTVNEEEDIRQLALIPAVKIILTDEDYYRHND